MLKTYSVPATVLGAENARVTSTVLASKELSALRKESTGGSEHREAGEHAKEQ